MQFRDLIVKQSARPIVRLKDVANVSLGNDDYESEVGFDGQRAVYIGIQVAPAANLLDVIKGVRTVFPSIQAQLPQGLNGTIVYNSTDFVSSSIREVVALAGRGAADRHRWWCSSSSARRARC